MNNRIIFTKLVIYSIIYRKERRKNMNDLNMDKLVNFCKQYGFIFQGSEIYGGLANTWDLAQ